MVDAIVDAHALLRLPPSDTSAIAFHQSDPVYRAAVRHFGRDVILDDARKEVLTLRWSIRQMMGNAVYEPDVQDSIADVEIACAMLRVIVGDSAVDAAKVQKLDRLVRRMGGGE